MRLEPCPVVSLHGRSGDSLLPQVRGSHRVPVEGPAPDAIPGPDELLPDPVTDPTGLPPEPDPVAALQSAAFGRA